VTLETAELAALEGQGHRLSPEEIGLLAKRLAKASDPPRPRASRAPDPRLHGI